LVTAAVLKVDQAVVADLIAELQAVARQERYAEAVLAAMKERGADALSIKYASRDLQLHRSERYRLSAECRKLVHWRICFRNGTWGEHKVTGIPEWKIRNACR
jgi:hypothetical protein